MSKSTVLSSNQYLLGDVYVPNADTVPGRLEGQGVSWAAPALHAGDEVTWLAVYLLSVPHWSSGLGHWSWLHGSCHLCVPASLLSSSPLVLPRAIFKAQI